VFVVCAQSMPIISDYFYNPGKINCRFIFVGAAPRSSRYRAATPSPPPHALVVRIAKLNLSALRSLSLGRTFSHTCINKSDQPVYDVFFCDMYIAYSYLNTTKYKFCIFISLLSVDMSLT
jgi:hypothetical protein